MNVQATNYLTSVLRSGARCWGELGPRFQRGASVVPFTSHSSFVASVVAEKEQAEEPGANPANLAAAQEKDLALTTAPEVAIPSGNAVADRSRASWQTDETARTFVVSEIVSAAPHLARTDAVSGEAMQSSLLPASATRTPVVARRVTPSGLPAVVDWTKEETPVYAPPETDVQTFPTAVKTPASSSVLAAAEQRSTNRRLPKKELAVASAPSAAPGRSSAPSVAQIAQHAEQSRETLPPPLRPLPLAAFPALPLSHATPQADLPAVVPASFAPSPAPPTTITESPASRLASGSAPPPLSPTLTIKRLDIQIINDPPSPTPKPPRRAPLPAQESAQQWARQLLERLELH